MKPVQNISNRDNINFVAKKTRNLAMSVAVNHPEASVLMGVAHLLGRVEILPGDPHRLEDERDLLPTRSRIDALVVNDLDAIELTWLELVQILHGQRRVQSRKLARLRQPVHTVDRAIA